MSSNITKNQHIAEVFGKTVQLLCKGHPWDDFEVSTTEGCPLVQRSVIKKYNF